MSISSPAIEIRANRAGQPRAYLVGTRVRVQDIYSFSEVQGLSPEEISRSLPHLTLAQIHAALAYYFDHRDEILKELREDEAFVSEFRRTHGEGPLAAKLAQWESNGHDTLPLG
jgi:uncharacterized protein (DUF433 family)